MAFKEFGKAIVARAVRTFCQTAVALIGTGMVGIMEVDWVNTLSVSAVAFLASLLTSVAAGMPEVGYVPGGMEVDTDGTDD